MHSQCFLPMVETPFIDPFSSATTARQFEPRNIDWQHAHALALDMLYRPRRVNIAAADAPTRQMDICAPPAPKDGLKAYRP